MDEDGGRRTVQRGGDGDMPVTLQPHGLTARQAGARAMWVRRRETHGPSGFSAAGLQSMRLNLVAAQVRNRTGLSKKCRRGHRRQPGTATCLSCHRLRYHAKKRAAAGDAHVALTLAALWAKVLEAHPDKHPDDPEATEKFLAAMERYDAACLPAAAAPMAQPVSGAEELALALLAHGSWTTALITERWMLVQRLHGVAVTMRQARNAVRGVLCRMERARTVRGERVGTGRNRGCRWTLAGGAGAWQRT